MNENRSWHDYYWNFRDPLVGSLPLGGIMTHSEKNSITSPNLKFLPLFSLSNPPKKVTFHIKGDKEVLQKKGRCDYATHSKSWFEY